MKPPETFEDNTANTIATLRSWLIVVTAAVAITLGLTIWGFTRSSAAQQATSVSQQAIAAEQQQIKAEQQAITAAARTTCLIQSRGLGAEVHLRAFLVDLDKLAIRPQTRAERLAQQREPADVRRLDRKAIRALNLYVRDIKHQPRGRSC